MKSECNLAEILLEVDMITFWEDGSKALMCNNQIDGIERFKPYKHIMSAVNEIATAKEGNPIGVMINKLCPGVIVPKHWDNVPGKPKRWHLPLITNPQSWWWDALSPDGVREHFELGIWVGPLPYWAKHQVGNEGTTERVHLVVDLLC
jgi:hypothetical protein